MLRVRTVLRSHISAWFADADLLGIYAKRRERLLGLAKGRHVVAATSANMFYVTDFCGGGIAIVEPDRTVVVTSIMEADTAKQVGNEVEVVAVKRGKDIPAAVAKHLGRGDVLIDDDSQFRRSKRFTRKPDVFLEARRVKDDEEMRRITKASKVLDEIFASLQAEIRSGRTEWEVAAEVMRQATLGETVPTAFDASLFPTIIASGPNGALPHAGVSSRKIRRGDFVVADIFFRYAGYNSDATRTYAVGGVTGEMRRSYEAVLESQEAALEKIRVGEVCGDVNEAAVSVLRKHHLERYLTHSIGHGVGIDIHELPSISKGNKKALLKNDVVTDEPGVYFKGRYGIRIEDTVRVDAKPVPLTRYTRDLVIVG
jgi:Xaa-Pro aminopeptidase